jgi:outer membrane murein-binding lipoprotein Lpp
MTVALFRAVESAAFARARRLSETGLSAASSDPTVRDGMRRPSPRDLQDPEADMNHGMQWWTRLAPEVQAALVTAVAMGVVALLGVAGTILAGIISTSRPQKAALHQFQLQAEREDRIRREQALQASRDAAREERKQAYARFMGWSGRWMRSSWGKMRHLKSADGGMS